jgi:RHS repeat-associated protein
MSTALRTYYRGYNLVGMRDEVASATRYYHFDHQGTTQCLTDGTGAVTDRFASDAWGMQAKRTGTSINRQWYIGNWGYYRQVDQVLDYVRMRYLQVGLGRWLSRDRASQRVDEGWYHYIRNRPATSVDPSGLVEARVIHWWVKGSGMDWTTIQPLAQSAAAIWTRPSGLSLNLTLRNEKALTRIPLGNTIVGLPLPLPDKLCICIDQTSNGGRGRQYLVDILNWKQGEHGTAALAIMRFVKIVSQIEPAPGKAFVIWTASDDNDPHRSLVASSYYPDAPQVERVTFWWQSQNNLPASLVPAALAHEWGHSLWGLHHAGCGLMAGDPTSRAWTPRCLSKICCTGGQGRLPRYFLARDPGVEIGRNHICEPQDAPPCDLPQGASPGTEFGPVRAPSLGIIRGGSCPRLNGPCP